MPPGPGRSRARPLGRMRMYSDRHHQLARRHRRTHLGRGLDARCCDDGVDTLAETTWPKSLDSWHSLQTRPFGEPRNRRVGGGVECMLVGFLKACRSAGCSVVASSGKHKVPFVAKMSLWMHHSVLFLCALMYGHTHGFAHAAPPTDGCRWPTRVAEAMQMLSIGIRRKMGFTEQCLRPCIGIRLCKN